MERYLITGGAGFIGSALVRELLRRGAAVRIVDNFITGRRENLKEVQDRIEVLEGDIRDLQWLRGATQGVDYVLHQAALPSVPRSIEDPVLSNSINIDGTLNVLVAARDARVKRLVYAASSSAYGDTPTLPKHEAMPPQPLSPYAVTKLTGEYYGKIFTEVYGLQTVSLRYFNIFGPRQDPNSPYSGVLSRFITRLLEGKSPTIFGDGEQSRDFTYVDNAVHANLLACTAPQAPGRILNVGTGGRYTLNRVLELLQPITATHLKPVYEAARSGDILHSQADITESKRVLGYEPLVSFEEGLRRTVEWFKQSLHKVEA
jgi:nucleoside-diphosphate-sugar epimerase